MNKFFASKKNNCIPAVVIGMTANGLAVSRALGRKGIPVFALDSDGKQPGMFSHYAKPLVCPDVSQNGEEFLQFLINLGKKFKNKSILFITADEYISFISEHREKLHPFFKFNFPEKSIVKSFLDKRMTYNIAKEYGLDCPGTYFISTLQDLIDIQYRLKYPCALKPVFSHIWKIKRGAQKLVVVDSADEIVSRYKELQMDNQQIMVQELIPGKDDQIVTFQTYFNSSHEPLAIFTKRKLRQYPVHFGVGSFHVSERNNELIKICLRFLKDIKYSGSAGLEFKCDLRDGKLKFIELNLRTLLSEGCAIACGINMPYIVYRDLTGQDVDKAFNFKEGIKFVNLELDIGSFWHYWQLKEMTFMEWIRSFYGRVVHTYFAWDDLFPFLYVSYRFLKIKLLNLVNKKYIKNKSLVIEKGIIKPNILHLISSGGFFGIEHMIVELVKKLNKFGMAQHVGIIRNLHNSHTEIFDILKQHNLSCVIFDCKGRLDFNSILTVREFIKKNNINIVHSHNYKSNFYAVISTLFLGVKRVTTVHNWLKTDYKLKLYALFDKLLLRRFNIVVSVSNSVKNEIIRAGIGKDKILLIKNGIDVQQFSAATNTKNIRDELGIKDHEKVVGSIGRISIEKGHRYLLEAATEIKGETSAVKFLIVGDGPLKEELIACRNKSQLGKDVIFTGLRGDIPVLLEAIDIFVLPSLVESFPMALLEAMASKKTIVATKVGEVPLVINDKQNGILVEPGDAHALAQAVIYLLNNANKAEEFAAEALKNVAAEFSSQKMAENYFSKVYKI